MEVPGALNGNIWIPRETSFFVRYAAPLSGSLSFSYFGQAKVHSVGEGSSVFSLNSYLNGPLDAIDLFNPPVTPSWTQALVAQSSSQIRNELNLVFRPTNTFNIVGGVDLRNGSIQADYVKGSDCIPFGLFSNFGDGDLKDGVKYNADNIFVVGRIFQLLAPAQPSGGVWIHCDQTKEPASLPASGGEHFAVRDIGAFAQASYKPNRARENSRRLADRQRSRQPRQRGKWFRHGLHATPRDYLLAAWFCDEGHLLRSLQRSFESGKVHHSSRRPGSSRPAFATRAGA